jgi:hypothetical protein
MTTPRYAYCQITDIRRRVEQRLDGLPAYRPNPAYGCPAETAAQFWARVEKAGLLVPALALYDEIAAGDAAERRVRRETRPEFERRVEREGRSAEAARVREELLASGLSQREAQEELVRRLQPLDGGRTKAWETPDPWLAGRLFRSKADQRRLLNLAIGAEQYLHVGEDLGDADDEGAVAADRLQRARQRREERRALAAARRRAQALAAQATK